MIKKEEKWQKEEELLSQISNGHQTDFSKEDKFLLGKMISQGLLKKKQGEYFLTKYGEKIKVMGFKVHFETQKFEEGLPFHNQKKSELITISLSFFIILLLLLVGLLNGL